MTVNVTLVATRVCSKWEHKLPLKSCLVCQRNKLEKEAKN